MSANLRPLRFSPPYTFADSGGRVGYRDLRPYDVQGSHVSSGTWSVSGYERHGSRVLREHGEAVVGTARVVSLWVNIAGELILGGSILDGDLCRGLLPVLLDCSWRRKRCTG